MKRLHWTQTPQGKIRMAEILSKRRQLKDNRFNAMDVVLRPRQHRNGRVALPSVQQSLSAVQSAFEKAVAQSKAAAEQLERATTAFEEVKEQIRSISTAIAG